MSKQELVNGELYLTHRNKINQMMDEVFHIPGFQNDGVTTELYLEWNYEPPLGATPNGSITSPFRTIEELEAVLNPANLYGCTVFLRPGRYGHTGTLELPPNVSWINEGARGKVVISTSILTANTNSEMRHVEHEGGFTVTLGTQGGLSTERVTFTQCDFFSNAALFCGVTEESNIQFIDCEIGRDAFANNVNCDGFIFIFHGCQLREQLTINIGSTTTSNRDRTLAKFSSCFLSTPNFTIFAEGTKTTYVTFRDCEILQPLILIPGLGTIDIEIDPLTYGHLIDVGQDFDAPNVNWRIRGLAEYAFDSTVITGTITDGQLEDVCTLDIPALQAGQYEFSVSFAYLHPDINDSLLWSLTDSMGALPQFVHESSDPQNHDTIGLLRPVAHAGGAFTTTLQMIVSPGGVDAFVDLVMISMRQMN